MKTKFPLPQITMRLILIGTFLLTLAGCALTGVSSNNESSKKLMIRVRNDSGLDIENFWLGAGPRGGSSGNTAFGAIKEGDTSRYHGVEPLLDNYRKLNFVADGQRYLDNIDPQEHVGQAELSLGWYTFAYDIVNGDPVLTLVEDPAP